MQELDVMNVRELEDFLINECMYAVGTLPSEFIFMLNTNDLLYWDILLTAEQTQACSGEAGSLFLERFVFSKSNLKGMISGAIISTHTELFIYFFFNFSWGCFMFSLMLEYDYFVACTISYFE
jgi:hypothetical protein